MASVLSDEDLAKVREMWRENMTARTTALPQADELSDMLDPDGELNADKRAVLTSKVQEWLRITLTSRADDRDRFTASGIFVPLISGPVSLKKWLSAWCGQRCPT